MKGKALSPPPNSSQTSTGVNSSPSGLRDMYSSKRRRLQEDIDVARERPTGRGSQGSGRAGPSKAADVIDLDSEDEYTDVYPDPHSFLRTSDDDWGY